MIVYLNAGMDPRTENRKPLRIAKPLPRLAPAGALAASETPADLAGENTKSEIIRRAKRASL